MSVFNASNSILLARVDDNLSAYYNKENDFLLQVTPSLKFYHEYTHVQHVLYKLIVHWKE